MSDQGLFIYSLAIAYFSVFMSAFALFFRDGELQVLNYSLMIYLSKEDCTEADLDQAIAYFTNLQQQSADQAKKILLSV